MIVFPIAATIAAAAFSLAAWRAAGTRGTAMRVWSLALAQFAVAAGALTWGLAFGWSAAAYRVFYLFGAVLNVGWLALGTVWLLAGPYASRAATNALIGLSVYAAVLVWLRGFVPSASEAIAAQDIPVPGDVMAPDVRAFARFFSIGGSAVLLGGLGWSIARRRRRVLGLSLLAAGVVVVAAASVGAGRGQTAFFSTGLAVGIGVMYLGFIKATS